MWPKFWVASSDSIHWKHREYIAQHSLKKINLFLPRYSAQKIMLLSFTIETPHNKRAGTMLHVVGCGTGYRSSSVRP